jgi:hypothetical protein
MERGLEGAALYRIRRFEYLIPFQVFNGGLKHGGIVAGISQHGVAAVAEQAAHRAGHVVVVDAELPGAVVAATADRADTTLCPVQDEELLMGQAELALTLPAHDLDAFPLRRFGTVLGAVFVPASGELGFRALWHLAEAVGQKVPLPESLQLALVGVVAVLPADLGTPAGKLRVGAAWHAAWPGRPPAVIALVVATGEHLAAGGTLPLNTLTEGALPRLATEAASALDTRAICILAHVGLLSQVGHAPGR